MKEYLIGLVDDERHALSHCTDDDAIGLSNGTGGIWLRVPRWLAEECKFELDHEHDDELAEADA